ncbi:MAG TPA: DUF3299 domain-containing protein [Nevskiales bacterium]|nr:DUF3299 domain-containing protein [Nevskiales bacterium]
MIRRLCLVLTLVFAAPAAAEKPVLQVFGENMDSASPVPRVQAFRGDLVYLVASLEDAAGQPLAQRALRVGSSIGNPILQAELKTDDEGYARFTVLAEKPGLDRITVRGERVQAVVEIQVAGTTAFRDPRLAKMLGGMPDLKDVIPWERFLVARFELAPDGASGRAEFPPELRRLDGQNIRLAGFMIPLDPEERQRRFMLSASPPNCYFHLPGGPATLVEVESQKGIPFRDEVLVLSGRLRLLTNSGTGVFFRLEQAAADR